MKFTGAEDALLRDLVQRFGASNWQRIAAHLPTRNARQCRERWSNYLDPGIAAPKEWTPEDEARLEVAWTAFGPRWTAIAACFPGRSTFNVKNRVALMRRRERQVLSRCVVPGADAAPPPGSGARLTAQGAPDEGGCLARSLESLDDLFTPSQSNAEDSIPDFFGQF
jgi:hypothetical protein